jgi:hypothetical protein
MYKETQMVRELKWLCRAALDLLSIPAQSAASERIFSVMNCVVTKGRCSLKQHNVGPLVQLAMRYKQQRVRKRIVTSNAEDFPPLGLKKQKTLLMTI